MIDRINDTSSITNATAYQIHRLARLLRVHISHWTQERLGITPEQWFILFRLHEKDGRMPSELADEVLNDYPNITRLVDGLVKKDYVERRPDPDDRRKQRLFITPTGQGQLENVFAEIISTRSDMYAGIEPEEIEQMLATMAKIEDNARRHMGI